MSDYDALGKIDFLKVFTYLITRSYDHWLISGCQTEIKEDKNKQVSVTRVTIL